MRSSLGRKKKNLFLFLFFWLIKHSRGCGSALAKPTDTCEIRRAWVCRNERNSLLYHLFILDVGFFSSSYSYPPRAIQQNLGETHDFFLSLGFLSACVCVCSRAVEWCLCLNSTPSHWIYELWRYLWIFYALILSMFDKLRSYSWQLGVLLLLPDFDACGAFRYSPIVTCMMTRLGNCVSLHRHAPGLTISSVFWRFFYCLFSFCFEICIQKMIGLWQGLVSTKTPTRMALSLHLFQLNDLVTSLLTLFSYRSDDHWLLFSSLQCVELEFVSAWSLMDQGGNQISQRQRPTFLQERVKSKEKPTPDALGDVFQGRKVLGKGGDVPDVMGLLAPSKISTAPLTRQFWKAGSYNCGPVHKVSVPGIDTIFSSGFLDLIVNGVSLLMWVVVHWNLWPVHHFSQLLCRGRKLCPCPPNVSSLERHVA